MKLSAALTATLTTALADRYAIEREIGRGGMATVFLARDLKHDRPVAVKVLNPELGAALGGARFLAEIATTATLQHPNLLPLFDSGEANGLLYYVMPYLDGETLRARMDRERQLPVEDAVRIATGIAQALAYAHARGVIHRDLKPENILLQHGQPVVLDFGIALAMSNAGGARMTQTGIAMGTPRYMSPEQAMGERVIDARADIYALGAVLYEMLAGESAHGGPTAQAIITKLMTTDPRPLVQHRSSVPPHVLQAVDRAMSRLPTERFPSAADFVRALDGSARDGSVRDGSALASANASGATTVSSGPTPGLRTVFPWGVAAVSIVLAAVAWLRPQAEVVTRTPAVPEAQDTSVVPGGARFLATGVSFAVSADGAQVVFVASDSNPQGSLFLRTARAPSAVSLPGTVGATAPFWSPDATSVAFFASRRLHTVELATGTVRDLCEVGDEARGTWGAEGHVIVRAATGALTDVDIATGTCAPLTLPSLLGGDSTMSRGSRQPAFLGDGRHFIVAARDTVWLAQRGASWTAALAPLRGGNASVVAPDELMLSRPDGSYRQRIDVITRALVGEVLPVSVASSRGAGGGS